MKPLIDINNPRELEDLAEHYLACAASAEAAGAHYIAKVCRTLAARDKAQAEELRNK